MTGPRLPVSGRRDVNRYPDWFTINPDSYDIEEPYGNDCSETKAVKKDSLTFSIVNNLREITRVGERIDGFCAARGLESRIGYAVNLAIDEVLVNTITYGYEDEELHYIEITVCKTEDSIEVSITDDGREFDSSQVPETDFAGSLDGRPLGGLGLLLVHQVMDKVEYKRSGDRNILTFRKSIKDTGG